MVEVTGDILIRHLPEQAKKPPGMSNLAWRAQQGALPAAVKSRPPEAAERAAVPSRNATPLKK